MNKKILIGSIIAVALLTLVSFSSVVGYSSVKSDVDISVEDIKKEMGFQENTSDEDCRCDESPKAGGSFSLTCLVMFLFFIPMVSLMLTFGYPVGAIYGAIGTKLDCFWTHL